MATLLHDVVRHLEHRQVSSALIGGAALTYYGVARSTFDADLLTVAREVLRTDFWVPLRADADIEVRIGDLDDPLAGVVRISRSAQGGHAVDVVVAKHAFAREVVERAESVSIAGVSLRVARRADLVLMKLYAAGPQDLWDVDRLLHGAGLELIDEIDSRIRTLPEEAREVWARVRP
ncbi:MAG TPA: nucleotidyltransferase [Thermoanaerobaculia bacterium]|nr:nucleotidyltransferase [Thermoanaerobaculia bacterium]